MRKFKIGDKVFKHSGYMYYGTVIAVFRTMGGKTRLVVEHLSSPGLLQIFNPEELRPTYSDDGGEH